MSEPSLVRRMDGFHTPAIPLRVTFSWTLFGYLAYAAGQWITVVILAKLGSPEMVGQYALGLTVTAPVILFCNLQLRSLQVTDGVGEYSFGDYLGLRLAGSLIAILIVVAVLAVGHFGRETASIILFVGVLKAIDAIADIYGGLCQQHERMDRAALSQVWRAIAGPLAMAVSIRATGDLLIGVLALVGVSIAVLASFDRASGRIVMTPTNGREALHGGDVPKTSLRPRWQWRRMTKLAATGLPLGLMILLFTLNNNIPGYVINRSLGPGPLGIFAALAFLTLILPTVVNALGQSASRRLALAFTERDLKAFRRLTSRLLLVALSLSAVAVAVATFGGRDVLRILYTADYGEQSRLFILLMCGATVASLASVLGVALTATRCFLPQLPLAALIASLTLGASIVLVPLVGLRGAAWAVLLGSIVQMTALGLLLVRRLAKSGGQSSEVTLDHPGRIQGHSRFIVQRPPLEQSGRPCESGSGVPLC
jgi:O-antigen/teichoic acid export membrane protein